MRQYEVFKYIAVAFVIFACGYVLGILDGEEHALLKVKVSRIAETVIANARREKTKNENIGETNPDDEND